ncbi:MAG: hypothetical protein EHM18_00370 [Acidobacteria bacterium]|nr:MAG: hypothetical protein EHM18_00370 [Acidobacteriota bacterium]
MEERALADISGVPTSWSQDGRWLAVSEFRSGSGWNLLALDFRLAERSGFWKPPFLNGKGKEREN